MGLARHNIIGKKRFPSFQKYIVSLMYNGYIYLVAINISLYHVYFPICLSTLVPFSLDRNHITLHGLHTHLGVQVALQLSFTSETKQVLVLFGCRRWPRYFFNFVRFDKGRINVRLSILLSLRPEPRFTICGRVHTVYGHLLSVC